MKKIKWMLIVAMFILLSGCWSGLEISDRAFILGVALDTDSDDIIELTAQMFKPTTSDEDGKMEPSTSVLTITEENDTTSSISSSLPIQVGRKVSWGHLSLIMIGEELAKQGNLDRVLNYFFRATEPRSSTSIIIVEGRAGDFIKTRPLMETMTAKQFFKIQQSASKFSGKFESLTLLQAAIESNNNRGDFVIPFVRKQTNESNNKQNEYEVGGAIFRNGKMTDIIAESDIPYFLMLKNQFKYGTINFPCSEKADSKGAFRIYSEKTDIIPTVIDDHINVTVRFRMKGVLEEISCSTFKTDQDEQKIKDSITETIKQGLEAVTQNLQNEKSDALGIGIRLYRKNPAIWRTLEEAWSQRFAEASFKYEGDIYIEGSGHLVEPSIMQ